MATKVESMTGDRIARAVLHGVDVVMALPLFAALTLLSPLLKPRGGVAYARYRFVNGMWCKTFWSDDMAHRPPEPNRQLQATPADASPVPARGSRTTPPRTAAP